MLSSAGPGPGARNALLAADIEQRLREAGNPDRAAGERAYLKSSMEFAGVGLPGLRRIVRALLPRGRALARDDLLAVVTELWARPLFECRLAASMLLGDHAEALIPADAPVKPLPPETAARLLAAYRARPTARASGRP